MLFDSLGEGYVHPLWSARSAVKLKNCGAYPDLTTGRRSLVPMDRKVLDEAIAELRKQKAHLEQVIGILELAGRGKRPRGRPSKLLSEALRAAQEARANKARTKQPRAKKAPVKKAPVKKPALKTPRKRTKRVTPEKP